MLPARSAVKEADAWDLSTLFPSDEAWETAFDKWKKQIPKFESFRGTLADGPKQLAACLAFDEKFDRAAERIGTYAFLKTTEDQANSVYQRMVGRYQNVASEAAQAAACSCESAHGDLLELAGKAAALNRQVASRLLAQHNAAGPPVHSLSPASIVGSPEHKLGAAGGGHAPPVSLNPAVQTVWDNGGSNTSRLTYELDEVDETEYQEGQLGFETQARAPVTRTLDNLMPSNRYKKKFAEEVQLGAHTAKMASGYVDVMTPTEFTFKTVPDIKFGDYKQVLDAIPEPWVQVCTDRHSGTRSSYAMERCSG